MIKIHVTVGLSLTKELYDKLRKFSESEERTLANSARFLIKKGLEVIKKDI